MVKAWQIHAFAAAHSRQLAAQQGQGQAAVCPSLLQAGPWTMRLAPAQIPAAAQQLLLVLAPVSAGLVAALLPADTLSH